MFRLLLGLAIGVAVGMQAPQILAECRKMLDRHLEQAHPKSHAEEGHG